VPSRVGGRPRARARTSSSSSLAATAFFGPAPSRLSRSYGVWAHAPAAGGAESQFDNQLALQRPYVRARLAVCAVHARSGVGVAGMAWVHGRVALRGIVHVPVLATKGALARNAVRTPKSSRSPSPGARSPTTQVQFPAHSRAPMPCIVLECRLVQWH
jgi:hypothetical protein